MILYCRFFCFKIITIGPTFLANYIDDLHSSIPVIVSNMDVSKDPLLGTPRKGRVSFLLFLFCSI